MSISPSVWRLSMNFRQYFISGNIGAPDEKAVNVIIPPPCTRPPRRCYRLRLRSSPCHWPRAVQRSANQRPGMRGPFPGPRSGPRGRISGRARGQIWGSRGTGPHRRPICYSLQLCKRPRPPISDFSGSWGGLEISVKDSRKIWQKNWHVHV